VCPAPEIPQVNPDYIERFLLPWARLARAYHRYEIEGVEHLRDSGPTIVIGNHSLVTYDNFIAFAEVYRQTGRVVRPLGDDFWFRSKAVGSFLKGVGVVPASRDIARAMLKQGELVVLSAGGMWEALKPSTERFTLRWKKRRGFARLALATGAPIALSVTPAADLVMTVYPSRLTDMAYKRWHLPLAFVRGWGPTLIPRPVPLRTHVSPLVRTPDLGGAEPTEDQVEQFRQEVHTRMQEWMRTCVRADGLEPADPSAV
jgi:1-acyl-sn-glycerol-3-phosphate acyltransferase